MKKTHTLLKVMAVIYIIMGVISLASNIYSFINMDAQNELLSQISPGGPQLTAGTLIFSIIVAAIELIAGVLVFVKKDKKINGICGIVILACVIISLIVNTVSTGFSAIYIASFIMPALFLWGVYLSE